MGSSLPPLSLSRFERELKGLCAVDLPSSVYEALHLHYDELRRWNPRLSLIGPGTISEILSRHYGESLAALPLLRDADRRLVDLGSGAGFPGLVLAAARPRLEVTLVDARQRKWAFLRSCVRRSGLSCQCLNARVGRLLPEDFPTEVDLVTSRGLALTPNLFEAILATSPGARFLLWRGEAPPRLCRGLTVCRGVQLERSDRRQIVEVCRS